MAEKNVHYLPVRPGLFQDDDERKVFALRCLESTLKIGEETLRDTMRENAELLAEWLAEDDVSPEEARDAEEASLACAKIARRRFFDLEEKNIDQVVEDTGLAYTEVVRMQSWLKTTCIKTLTIVAISLPSYSPSIRL